jgi:CheY-like chemotaxis protein
MPHRSRHILIIDDDQAIRDSLKMVLELEGYAVATAANGRDGLRELETSPKEPCLIVVDLMMPIMNGWEFLDAIGQDPRLRCLPVLILTAHNERARPLPQRPILRKPIDSERFLKLVRTNCGDPGA